MGSIIMPASIMFKYIIHRPDLPKVDLLLVRSETIGKRLRCLVEPDQVLEVGGSRWRRGHGGTAGTVGGRPSSGACVLAVAGRRP
jgi:hypothetical protein